MIRRAVWLAAGAVLGVAGYRRAATLTRFASASWQARAAAGFAADVRDGMTQYLERHPQRASSTLGQQRQRGNGWQRGHG